MDAIEQPTILKCMWSQHHLSVHTWLQALHSTSLMFTYDLVKLVRKQNTFK